MYAVIKEEEEGKDDEDDECDLSDKSDVEYRNYALESKLIEEEEKKKEETDKILKETKKQIEDAKKEGGDLSDGEEPDFVTEHYQRMHLESILENTHSPKLKK